MSVPKHRDGTAARPLSTVPPQGDPQEAGNARDGPASEDATGDAATRVTTTGDSGTGDSETGGGEAAATGEQGGGTDSPEGPSGRDGQGGAGSQAALTLLVVEDDPNGAVRLSALPGTPTEPIRTRTARNLTEAERLLTDDVHCILLDLALPAGTQPGSERTGQPDDGAATDPTDDAHADELSTLRRVLRLAPRHAVLALTDGTDAALGAEAVRVGAQDYLFRDELDGRLLSRAIRYAVERKRSDLAQRQLTESRLRAQENARLERGLLPTPLLQGSELSFAARYRPGRSRALLGGDFYDTVRTVDGTVHVMIGDVSGHGPDEAALGVELRIAWRALTFAGLCGDALLETLQRVLEYERPSDEVFATLCTMDIAPDGRSAEVYLAGHPAPLLDRGRGDAVAPGLLAYDESGPALGLLPGAHWPRRRVELGSAWSLLLYTDGLIEGRIGVGRQRLGQEGIVELVTRHLREGLRGEALLDATMAEVRALNGGELTDDVAVLLLGRD